MLASPAVAASLAFLPIAPEPFGHLAIGRVFIACIAAAGLDNKLDRDFALIQLWSSDSVLSAIEALQDEHEAGGDTVLLFSHLLAKIEAEILNAE